MKIRIKPFDEFYYKFVFLLFGILYWIYGLHLIIDPFVKGIVVISLIPSIYNLTQIDNNDYRKIASVSSLVFGIGTLLTCEFFRNTAIVIAYFFIKIILLGYCSPKKNRDCLQKELSSLLYLIYTFGVIVSIVSLWTYFTNISIPYTLTSNTDSTGLFLGISTRRSLCGIMANENMLSNMCVLFIASTLFLFERSKHKILAIVSLLLGLVTQYLTASRGGLVGVIIVVGLFFWYKYHFFANNRQIGRVFRWFSIFSFVSAIIIYLIIGGRIDIFSILNRSTESYTSNTQTRLYLWDAATKAIGSSIMTFIFGIGHNISSVMKDYCSVVLDERLYTNVHNAYLQYALEFGVPAAFVLLFYFWKTMHGCFKSFYQHSSTLIILLSTIIALLVINFVESDFLGIHFEGTIIWIFGSYYNSLKRV